MAANREPKLSDLLLSAATIPFLASLVVSRVIAQAIVAAGEASEEIFRGDRLPVLRQPLAVTELQNPSESQEP